MVPASPHPLSFSALLNHHREHQIPLGLPDHDALTVVPAARVEFESTGLYWSYEYSTEWSACQATSPLRLNSASGAGGPDSPGHPQSRAAALPGRRLRKHHDQQRRGGGGSGGGKTAPGGSAEEGPWLKRGWRRGWPVGGPPPPPPPATAPRST